MLRSSTQWLLLGVLALNWLASAVERTTVPAEGTTPPPGPRTYFDPDMPTNVTVKLGATAKLPCMVRQLGGHSVVWIRSRDLHVLTVGRFTFTSDQRVQVNQERNTDDWTMTIRYASLRDAGAYTCEVSTDPRISWVIHLNVIVPKAEITGAPEVFIKAGSTLTLTCVISSSMESPTLFYWYKGDQLLRLASSLSGMTIESEMLPDQTTVSRLSIAQAQRSHSDNYTCSPSASDSASVEVHVLNGESGTESTEEPAATVTPRPPKPEAEDFAEFKKMMRSLLQEMKALKSELMGTKSSMDVMNRKLEEVQNEIRMLKASC